MLTPHFTKWLVTGSGIIIIIIIISTLQIYQARHNSPTLGLSRYDYRDTRQLVALVARAAALIEKKGEEAFREFTHNPGKWSLGENSYLYVYDMNGYNLFHGGYPELKGKNLFDSTDLQGKKPVEMIVEQLKNHRDDNPHGWIHYLWMPPGLLDVAWKSSCNFEATMPDGRRVFVGGGIDQPLQEREFYRIIVSQAVEFIRQNGKDAIYELNAPDGRFTIHDQGLFAIDLNGNVIIQPGFDLDIPQNFFEYRDLTGRRPIMELSKQLNQNEEGWVITIHRKKSGSKIIKNGIYGRKVKVDGEDLIIGSICPMPRPAWMR